MIEEEETPPDISLRNLIETKIIVEFEIQDGLVHEEAQMQFKPDILVKDMIEKIIDNFFIKKNILNKILIFLNKLINLFHIFFIEFIMIFDIILLLKKASFS